MKSISLRPQSHASPTDDGLKRAIKWSVGLHVGIFVLLTVRAVFYPSEPIPLENSIRVDIVALPDKSPMKPVEAPSEPEAPKPVEPAKQEPTKPEPVAVKPAPPKPAAPKVDLNKTKREQADALKRLEALEKIKAMKEPEPAQTAGLAKAPPPIKGNEISAGTALKGLAKLNHENYTQKVHEHVRRHWNLPQWMTNANLAATVQLYIDAQGNVVKKVLKRASKQPVFDDRVMRAIESASPMPRPPSDLVNILAVDGIEIEFAPEG